MAITQALFKGYTRTGTSYQVRVQLTDAAKSPSTYEKMLQVSGTTLNELTQDAARQIAALIAADAQQDLLAGIAVDTAIPLAPTPPAGPTAGDIADSTWLANARLLGRVKTLQTAGLAGAQVTTDVAGLTTIVNNGYTTARALKL